MFGDAARGEVAMHILSLYWLRHVALALLLTATLAACGSPEDGRARGGGPGADVGNHSRNDPEPSQAPAPAYRPKP